jgi:NTP pyrophosphatase (non-canonical NTP hydrolase)
VEDLRRQVRELKAHKGFDITLEQRLAYLTSEVGEVAEEDIRLSRNDLLDLADLAGVDLEGAFEKKARQNEGREW